MSDFSEKVEVGGEINVVGLHFHYFFEPAANGVEHSKFSGGGTGQIISLSPNFSRDAVDRFQSIPQSR